jgi:hypothetical protein
MDPRNTLLQKQQELEAIIKAKQEAMMIPLSESTNELSLYDEHPADIGSEVLEREKDADTLFSFDKFRDYYSHDDIDIILDQALKIVTEQVAPTNEEGDTIQARFEDGAVTVPSSFHSVYRFLNQEGWGISK